MLYMSSVTEKHLDTDNKYFKQQSLSYTVTQLKFKSLKKRIPHLSKILGEETYSIPQYKDVRGRQNLYPFQSFKLLNGT